MTRPSLPSRAAASCAVLSFVLVLALLSAAVPARAAESAPPPYGAAGEGLWTGAIVYEPGAVEVDLVLEIGPTAGGGWVGTVDVPALKLEYHPVDRVAVDGSRVVVRFERRFPGVGRTIPYTLTGTLSPAGDRIEGELVEGPRPPFPVVLHRLGPMGSERPSPSPAAVAPVGPGAAELRARFNSQAGKARLLMLLSPTCGRCIITANVVRRHLLESVADERLALFTVWGPMLGDETLDDARAATVHLPDRRAAHFWAPDQELATQVGEAIGLEGHPAWKALLLYSPEARWGGHPPEPEATMHVGLPLPEDQAFHAERLAREVRALLESGAGRAASTRP